MSRKVRGSVQIQSNLEQNLTLILYRSMQVCAPLIVVGTSFAVYKFVFEGKGNI